MGYENPLRCYLCHAESQATSEKLDAKDIYVSANKVRKKYNENVYFSSNETKGEKSKIKNQCLVHVMMNVKI